ncbi:hypothetical protein [Endozoicomonas sp. SESOKO1]|uniref:hypothetical protein n=1 Tax=Endozoicomonas sp. SESOKO1 TaxID=2828742 RepID=UPI0021495D10|nr:hypothetical protein [Endozoicomonas sp. SESOKO1]
MNPINRLSNHLSGAEKRPGCKASALTLAILSVLVSTGASAEEIETDQEWLSSFSGRNRVMLKNVNSFKAETYWNRNLNDHDTKYTANGAIVAHFASGMMGSKKLSMGIDLGATYMYRLGNANYDKYLGTGGFPQTECETGWRDREVCQVSHNFSRVSQVSVKGVLGESREKNTRFNIGLGYLSGGMVSAFNPDTSLIPRSYLGGEFTTRWNKMTLSGAYIVGRMGGADRSVSRLTMFQDSRVLDTERVTLDYVSSLQAHYRTDNMDFVLGYSNGDSFMQRYVGRVGYFGNLDHDQSYRFDAAYSMNTFGGSNYDELVALGMRQPEGEERANQASVRAQYNHGNVSLVMSHSRVGGNVRYGDNIAGVSNDGYHFAEGAFNDHTLPGDTSQTIAMIYRMYDFDVPIINDLTLNYTYNRGKRIRFGDRHETGTAEDHAVNVQYTKSGGAFKGARFNVKFAWFDPDSNWRPIIEGEPGDAGREYIFDVVMNIPFY